MRVLFIGNSHTYFNDMPLLFSHMYRQLRDDDISVSMIAYSGRTLRWHIDEYFTLRFALMNNGYDYAVIQQYAHPFPQVEETESSMADIISLIRECNVKPVIFMSWAEKAKPYMTKIMSDTYRDLAKIHRCPVVPVGEIFADLNDKHPDIDLYFRDGEHASPYGDYLISACFASFFSGIHDLSGLDDRGIDFGVRMPENASGPVAETDGSKIWIDLDPNKTAVIKTAVRDKLNAE